MATTRFKRGSGCYICRCCKKQTRETGDGESSVDLCAKCYLEAGLENEHSDNGHDEFNPDCPTCREEREAASERIRQNAYSQPNTAKAEGRE